MSPYVLTTVVLTSSAIEKFFATTRRHPAPASCMGGDIKHASIDRKRTFSFPSPFLDFCGSRKTEITMSNIVVRAIGLIVVGTSLLEAPPGETWNKRR
jgi:hypothetical protein